MKRLQIIQSNIEPNKNVLWLDRYKNLNIYAANGWENLIKAPCENVINNVKHSFNSSGFIMNNNSQVLYNTSNEEIQNEEYAKYYDRLLAGERQEVFKDMLLAGFEPVFELMNPHVYYEISSLKDLDGFSDELKDRFLYGDKTKEFNLPEWFVPMVNALPEVEREIVLKQAQSKLQNSIDAFLQKVESGEFEIIENWDSERGVLLEDGENLRYMYLPDFKNLKSSPAAEELKKMIEDFIKNS
jgi:hypothetical protein